MTLGWGISTAQDDKPIERVRTLPSFDMVDMLSPSTTASTLSPSPSGSQDRIWLHYFQCTVDIVAPSYIIQVLFPRYRSAVKHSFIAYVEWFSSLKDSLRGSANTRMTKLSEDQKEQIRQMASPQCMEASERKRQYSAMGRAIHKSCNPSLLAKYQLCSDTERWEVRQYFSFFFEKKQWSKKNDYDRPLNYSSIPA